MTSGVGEGFEKRYIYIYICNPLLLLIQPSIHPCIHSLLLLQFRVVKGLDPIPAAIGQNNPQNKLINIVDHFKGDHSRNSSYNQSFETISSAASCSLSGGTPSHAQASRKTISSVCVRLAQGPLPVGHASPKRHSGGTLVRCLNQVSCLHSMWRRSDFILSPSPMIEPFTLSLRLRTDTWCCLCAQSHSLGHSPHPVAIDEGKNRNNLCNKIPERFGAATHFQPGNEMDTSSFFDWGFQTWGF